MAGRAPLAESVYGCGDAGGAVPGPGSDAAGAESGWAALGAVSPRSIPEGGCCLGGAWQGRAGQWWDGCRVAGIAAAVPRAVWEERREAAWSQGSGPAGGGLGCEPGRHWRLAGAVHDGSCVRWRDEGSGTEGRALRGSLVSTGSPPEGYEKC